MVRTALVALAVFFLAGCATPIDWQARVGVYTYDQAVMEYGPPMSFAKLSDHSIVADWMIQRGAIIATPGPPAGPTFYGPGWGGWGGYYYPTYFPARYLRLQFGPDGKLKTWKEFSR